MSSKGSKLRIAFVAVVMIPGTESLSAPAEWCPMDGMIYTRHHLCGRDRCDEPAERDRWEPGTGTTDLTIRIKFTIFCQDEGLDECAASIDDVLDAVGYLNNDFDDEGIVFAEAVIERERVWDPRFYDFCGSGQQRASCLCDDTCRTGCQSEELDMKTAYASSPDEQMNIYVVLHLYENTSYFGYGYWPWCEQATGTLGGIIIDGRCLGDQDCLDLIGPPPNKTLSHEMGHNLGLYHVFEGFDPSPPCHACYEGAECTGVDPQTGECLNPDCEEVGDFCCDTAASNNSASCSSVEATDCAYDLVYNPTRRNHMSYADDDCRTYFTDNQAARLHCWTCDELSSLIPNDQIGSCCRSGGGCQETSDTCCDNVGGTFRGSGTTCSEQVSACCIGFNHCIDTTQECCATQGGLWIGSDTCQTVPSWRCPTQHGPVGP